MSATQIMRTARAKASTGLAWASWVSMFVGGTLIQFTPLGNQVANALNGLPELARILALLGLTVGMCLDLFKDGIPNQFAVYSMLIIPSLARSTTGKLGAEITNGGLWLANQISPSLREWLGSGSAVTLAACCALLGVLLARRFVSKSKTAAMGR